jgi:hypothetical protein
MPPDSYSSAGKMSLKQTCATITLFAIAMAFLEATVVLYLRLLYYPNGSLFPLVAIPKSIITVEILREVATLIMLAAVAWLSGRSVRARLSCFFIAFGIWDIFYYVFLRVVINWPSSLLTDDVLFLIPLPWVGPVLAPILVSLCLIAAGAVVLFRESGGHPIHVTPLRLTIICLGGALVVSSFLQNSGAVIHQQPLAAFNWFLFTTGILVALSSFIAALKQ